MPTVVATRVSSPIVSSSLLSSPLRDFTYYNSPFEYRGYGYPYSYNYRYSYNYPAYNYGYNYSYGYPYSSVYSAPIYQSPTAAIVVAPPAATTTYGTCKAVTGVGVTSNSCAPNKVAVATTNNGCMCADQTTGLAGCGNVLNGVCK